MTSDCTIIRLEPGGLERIVPVMNSAFDPYFGEAWTISQCRGVMSLPGSQLFAAECDDELCGFALVRAVLDEAELLLLAVRPESQTRGIGRVLVNHVLCECRGSGVASIHLEVRENNPALRFYTNSGFSVIGLRRDYYKSASGETFNAITLTRTMP